MSSYNRYTGNESGLTLTFTGRPFHWTPTPTPTHLLSHCKRSGSYALLMAFNDMPRRTPHGHPTDVEVALEILSCTAMRRAVPMNYAIRMCCPSRQHGQCTCKQGSDEDCVRRHRGMHRMHARRMPEPASPFALRISK